MDPAKLAKLKAQNVSRLACAFLPSLDVARDTGQSDLNLSLDLGRLLLDPSTFSLATGSVGGKGTPRRKVIKKSANTTAANDQKLQGALKKLNLQPITGVEEVNMFQNDGNVLHFTAPKVHAALASNTMAVYGTGHVKELTELVPGILSQLGPDSLASLRKLAAQYQSQTAGAAGAINPLNGSAEAKEADDDDDDDVPDLVESFEPDEKKDGEEKKDEGAKLDELE